MSELEQRFRSRSSVTVVPCLIKNGVPDSYSGRTLKGVTSEECWDYVTPNYHELIKTGAQLPINPFRKVERQLEGYTESTTYWDLYKYGVLYEPKKYSISGPASVLFMDSYGGAGIYTLNSGWIPSFSAPDRRDEAIAKAIANYRSQSWDIATSIAEAKKTFEMIRTAATSVRERAHKVQDSLRKKGRTSRLPRFGAAIGSAFRDTWMEARYGWRPMMYDIEDAFGAYNEFVHGISNLTRGNSGSVESSSSLSTTVYADNNSVYGCNYGSGGPYHHRHTVTVEVGRIDRAGVCFEETMNFALQADPVITGYELVPYSWVVDKFTSLGDVLSALSPFRSGSFRWGYHTVELFTRLTWYMKARNYNGIPSSTWTYKGYGEHSHTVIRTDRTRSPLPDPAFNPIKAFKVDFSSWDLFDTIDVICLIPGVNRKLANRIRI